MYSGGLLWVVVDVAFVAVLAVALAYGLIKWSRRSKDRAVEQARDSATLRNYEADAAESRKHG